jgi:hypothetical protein
MGGEQSRPFLLSPFDASPPIGVGQELVGAEQVHRVLRRWLRECQGPQVPIGTPGATRQGAPERKQTSVSECPLPDTHV